MMTSSFLAMENITFPHLHTHTHCHIFYVQEKGARPPLVRDTAGPTVVIVLVHHFILLYCILHGYKMCYARYVVPHIYRE